jgi:uncharacterized membrane protein
MKGLDIRVVWLKISKIIVLLSALPSIILAAMVAIYFLPGLNEGLAFIVAFLILALIPVVFDPLSKLIGRKTRNPKLTGIIMGLPIVLLYVLLLGSGSSDAAAEDPHKYLYGQILILFWGGLIFSAIFTVAYDRAYRITVNLEKEETTKESEEGHRLSTTEKINSYIQEIIGFLLSHGP